MKPIIIENILPRDTLLHIQQEFDTGWQLINYSDVKDDKVFWIKVDANYINYFRMIAHDVILKIKRYYPFQDLEFLRMNINGQTFGQESSFHIDFPDESYTTLLIFTEPEWNQEWGGQVVVCLGPGQYETIPYIPNRGVIFTPCNDHKGLAPSRHCPIMRTTIAFFYKLHPQNQ